MADSVFINGISSKMVHTADGWNEVNSANEISANTRIVASVPVEGYGFGRFRTYGDRLIEHVPGHFSVRLGADEQIRLQYRDADGNRNSVELTGLELAELNHQARMSYRNSYQSQNDIAVPDVQPVQDTVSVPDAVVASQPVSNDDLSVDSLASQNDTGAVTQRDLDYGGSSDEDYRHAPLPDVDLNDVFDDFQSGDTSGLDTTWALLGEFVENVRTAVDDFEHRLIDQYPPEANEGLLRLRLPMVVDFDSFDEAKFDKMINLMGGAYRTCRQYMGIADATDISADLSQTLTGVMNFAQDLNSGNISYVELNDGRVVLDMGMFIFDYMGGTDNIQPHSDMEHEILSHLFNAAYTHEDRVILQDLDSELREHGAYIDYASLTDIYVAPRNESRVAQPGDASHDLLNDTGLSHSDNQGQFGDN